MRFSGIVLIYFLVSQFQEILCQYVDKLEPTTDCYANYSSLFSKKHHNESECMPVKNFVAAYARFLNTIPQNIYPVNTFCTARNSTFDYKSASYWFHNASSDDLCKAQNFHHNRLNIIRTLYDQMESIWSAAHCQSCVDHKNATDEFFTLLGELDDCIDQNSEHPCEPCAGNYSLVQDYYKNIADMSKGQICFDIEDRMNHTRYNWSAEYNCCKDKQHSTKAFVGFASLTCSLPVIFYAMMYFITMRKESREQAAMAPLLDNQPDGNVAEEPQPGCSGDGLLVEPDSNKDNVSVMNNLDQQDVKEGQLVALNEEPLIDTQIWESSPKDDVAILRGVTNLLD